MAHLFLIRLIKLKQGLPHKNKKIYATAAAYFSDTTQICLSNSLQLRCRTNPQLEPYKHCSVFMTKACLVLLHFITVYGRNT